jgi:hypothetical protein
MKEKEEDLKIRHGIYNYLLRNFIGPRAGEDEILEGSRPQDLYLTGALYPAGLRKNSRFIDPQDFEYVDGEGHQDSADDANAAAKDTPEESVLFPSSAGISFRLKRSVAAIPVSVSFGIYSPIELDGKIGFQRKQVRKDLEIKLGDSFKEWLLPDWVQLDVKVRDLPDSKLVTVTLLNRATKDKEEKNEKPWVFKNRATIWQVRIAARETDAGDIIPVTPLPRETNNHEVSANFLLYREFQPFASGHNCSADWSTVDGKRTVGSEFIPFHPLRSMVPATVAGADFNIKSFSNQDKLKNGLKSLKLLHRKYDEWINGIESDAARLEPVSLKPTAARLVSKAKEAAARIGRGIKILENNKDASWCFSFANEAIERQFRLQKRNEGKEFNWRPFQLAFFLLTLEGIVDSASAERKKADLLWFPTGGGKTEAYLLISAFTIAWRRVSRDKDRSGAGTTVILRYTLRLLTQQQLQRAARLICAMEELRPRYQDRLGGEEIGIGLWVGGGSFPNTVKEWEQRRSEGKAPTPFETCPSCSAPLQSRNYKPDKYKIGRIALNKLEVSCSGNPSCTFHNRPLPIHLTDEDVYQFNPAMIIGTVDKFANLAWKMEAGKIFNKYRFRCSKHGVFFKDEPRCICSKEEAERPPDLIIQDELHLISGPLGDPPPKIGQSERVGFCGTGPAPF